MIELLKQRKDLWELFTAREEYDPLILDKFDRFPYYISKNKNSFEPLVSEFLIENGYHVEYPDNKKFALCLTHDIDLIEFPIIADIARSIYHHEIKNALKRPFYKICKKCNPIWNFKEVMDLEEKYEATSSFYFMGLEKEDQDFNYRLEDIVHVLGEIIDRGWEVGLHGGHEAFNNLHTLKREKNRLEKSLGRDVTGYRNHFLRFKVPNSWELLKEAGFKYDTTFGHPHCASFRNGMCHPFTPFNLATGKFIDILEIPLTIMDNTLFDYMGLNMKGAWDLIEYIIKIVKKNNGVITILWHNTSMVGENLHLYEKILKYCYGDDAYICCGSHLTALNDWRFSLGNMQI